MKRKKDHAMLTGDMLNQVALNKTDKKADEALRASRNAESKSDKASSVADEALKGVAAVRLENEQKKVGWMRDSYARFYAIVSIISLLVGGTAMWTNTGLSNGREDTKVGISSIREDTKILSAKVDDNAKNLNAKIDSKFEAQSAQIAQIQQSLAIIAASKK